MSLCESLQVKKNSPEYTVLKIPDELTLCFSTKHPTWLFYSYFEAQFYPDASYNLTGCAIYTTRGRFCFFFLPQQNKEVTHTLPP